jgi:leucyl-tRNA synthetase
MGMLGISEPFASFYSNGWVTVGKTKISKRAGNTVGPDDYVEQYGADPVRLCILFIGPADEDMEWTEEGVEGMARFVRRLWRIVNDVAQNAPQGGGEVGALTRKAHATIAKVTDDVGRRYAFNTAISAVMELVNELSREPHGAEARFAAETAVSLLQPYAPHVTEELWQRLGHERLWTEPWPVADTSFLERATFELVVQVNGKVRDRVEVRTDASEEELIAAARDSERVRSFIDGAEVRQTIVVPQKLVNLVLGSSGTN